MYNCVLALELLKLHYRLYEGKIATEATGTYDGYFLRNDTERGGLRTENSLLGVKSEALQLHLLDLHCLTSFDFSNKTVDKHSSF